MQIIKWIEILICSLIFNYIFNDYVNLLNPLDVCKNKFFQLFLIILTFLLINYNLSVVLLLLYFLFFWIIRYLQYKSKIFRNLIYDFSFILLVVTVYLIIVFLSNTIAFIFRYIISHEVKLLAIMSTTLVIYFLIRPFFKKKFSNSVNSKHKYITIILNIVNSIILFALYSIQSFNFNSGLTITFLMICTFILAINIYFIYASNKLEELQKKEMEIEYLKMDSEIKLKHFNDIQLKYDKSNQIIHDIKNHMQMISVLLEQNENEQGNDYINTIKNKLNQLDRKFTSKNRLLDIIINEKYEYCLLHNIDFVCNSSDPDLSFLSDFDIVTILSNIIDNAIEAVKELASNRVIKLSIFEQNNNIIIRLNNPCNNELNIKNSKIVSSKTDHHGLGLRNVKLSLENYQGDFDIQIINNECEIFIRIPN